MILYLKLTWFGRFWLLRDSQLEMTLDSTLMLVQPSPGCESLLTNVALIRLVGRGNWPAPNLAFNIY